MRFWKSKKKRRHEEAMHELVRLRRENHERHHSPFAMGGETPRRSPDVSDKETPEQRAERHNRNAVLHYGGKASITDYLKHEYQRASDPLARVMCTAKYKGHQCAKSLSHNGSHRNAAGGVYWYDEAEGVTHG